MRKAWRARLRSPKLQLLGTLLGLSSRLGSALGERRTVGACGDPFPLAATPRGLEKTRSFKLTFWLLQQEQTDRRTHRETARGSLGTRTQASAPDGHGPHGRKGDGNRRRPVATVAGREDQQGLCEPSTGACSPSPTDTQELCVASR